MNFGAILMLFMKHMRIVLLIIVLMLFLSGVPVLSLDVTVLSSSTVFVLWTPRPGNIPQSYELEIRVVGAPNIPVMELTSGGTSRSRTVQNLAGGTQYEFTIRPIYADGIAGTDVSSVDSTRETGMWFNFGMCILFNKLSRVLIDIV